MSNLLTLNGKILSANGKAVIGPKDNSVEGVKVEPGPLSDNDLIIYGSKCPYNSIVLSGLNGNVFLIGNDEEKVHVKISAFTDITLEDTSDANKITSKNLESENIKKDVNILGVTGTFEGGSSGNTLKNLLDNTKSASYLFQNYQGDNLNDLIQYNDTENVEKFNAMFSGCKAKKLPLLNTSKGNNFIQFLRNCDAETIPAYNLSGGINFSDSFDLYKITSFLAYGMKVSFYIGRSTLLAAPALVTILSNCQVITSTQTLTMGSTLLAKLEGVYVKETGVEQYEGITCRPCVICESTDAGAMLATDYFTGKGWTLA